MHAASQARRQTSCMRCVGTHAAVCNLHTAAAALQNKQAVEEQHRLQQEKSVLIDTVKKLNREVAKLEAFKKNLLQHLQDDDEVRHKG